MHSRIILWIYLAIFTHFYNIRRLDAGIIVNQTHAIHWLKSTLFYVLLMFVHYVKIPDRFYNKLVTQTQTPLVTEVAYQWVVFDILYYIIHRFVFHHPRLFRSVHAIHHHSINPYFISTFYAHPLEHLITYLLVFIPSYLRPVRPLSLYIYVMIWIYAIMGSHDCIQHHLLHHAYHVGNYAITPLIDWAGNSMLQ